MAGYLLIESRDPFESADVSRYLALAGELARRGGRVTVFLAQNAVLGARAGAGAGDLAALLRAGVEVLADDFSLRERGITRDRLLGGVEPAPLDVVLDCLADGRKAMWH